MQTGASSDVVRLKSLVDLGSFLELHDLLRCLQEPYVDVGHHAGQAPPFLDGLVAGQLHMTFNLKTQQITHCKVEDIHRGNLMAS